MRAAPRRGPGARVGKGFSRGMGAGLGARGDGRISQVGLEKGKAGKEKGGYLTGKAEGRDLAETVDCESLLGEVACGDDGS